MGTRGIFSSYSGDSYSKLVFVQRSQDSCLVMRDTSGISSRLDRALLKLLEVRRETVGPVLVSSDLAIPINFQEESGIITF